MEHILVLDVPGIKEYVFRTERLVEIRGASALLDYLNREETFTFLKERLGNDNVKRIFAGGGSGQFTINASKGDLLLAVDKLKGLFHTISSGGLRLISGHAEMNNPAASSGVSVTLIDV